jgi:hypothetical protein
MSWRTPAVYLPYTYLIGWPKLDKWYYGVRYARDCNPADFWVEYFTSSPFVKEMVLEHGDPPVKQIRKTFKNEKAARLWETKVLKRIKIAKSERWININDRCAPPIKYGDDHAMRRPECRAKAKENNTGKGNPMFGKRQKRVICEHCDKEIGINTYKVWHGANCPTINPEHRNRCKETRRAHESYKPPLSPKTCEHCGITTTTPNYARWHGDRCKSKRYQ